MTANLGEVDSKLGKVKSKLQRVLRLVGALGGAGAEGQADPSRGGAAGDEAGAVQSEPGGRGLLAVRGPTMFTVRPHPSRGRAVHYINYKMIVKGKNDNFDCYVFPVQGLGVYVQREIWWSGHPWC